MSLALLPEPPETAFWGISVHFLGIAGGSREGSEDVDGVTGGFVSVALGVLDGVATGILDGVPLGVFDGVAPGFVSITGGLDGVSGEVEFVAG